MAEEPIRFGIIGCAQIAKKLGRAIKLAPNSTLYAIASRSIEKAHKFTRDNNQLFIPENVKIYGSYEEVVEDPLVEAVYLPLPTSLHVKWAVTAAKKKKHLLVEKPVALNVRELDLILEACKVNGVQFMDGTMWLHHPRSRKIKGLICDQQVFGRLNMIHTTSTFPGTEQFFKNNIRVNADLDALGALGDLGWYCIGAILWAFNYELPKTVTALPNLNCNQEGVILACGSSFQWGGGEEDKNKVATFYCSFLSGSSMDLTLYGTKGFIHLKDFIIPIQENSASFDLTSGLKFGELAIAWNVKPDRIEVTSELPQEALMVQEFGKLVQKIRVSGSCPDDKWPRISRMTQLVLDAIKKSIDEGFKPVNL